MPAVLTLQIQDNVDECLNMPSQIARKPGSDNQNEVCCNVPTTCFDILSSNVGVMPMRNAHAWGRVIVCHNRFGVATCCTKQLDAADYIPCPAVPS